MQKRKKCSTDFTVPFKFFLHNVKQNEQKLLFLIHLKEYVRKNEIVLGFLTNCTFTLSMTESNTPCFIITELFTSMNNRNTYFKCFRQE